MAELIAGLSIGLGAGISPGPLQTLVVTSALRRGFGAGWRVAVAPLFTDAPIVAVSIAVLSALPGPWLRVLGIAGGVVVAAMGAVELTAARRSAGTEPEPAADRTDYWRGILVNALSPHPWVFWIVAGAPLVVAAWRRAPWTAVAFVAGFYVTLIGSKVALAAVAAAGRRRLTAASRRRLLVAGSLLLLAGGGLLAWQAAVGRFG